MAVALAPYLIFLAFLLSYPIQVLTRGEVSGLFGIIMFCALCVMGLQTLTSRREPKISRPAFVALILLLPLPIAYCFPLLSNPSSYYLWTFIKTAVLFVTAAAVSIQQNIKLFVAAKEPERFHPHRHSIGLSWVLLGAPLAAMSVAILMNSMGAVPPDVNLDQKYFYGDFIRAGAGYVDPNTLGVSVVLVIAIFRRHLYRSKLLTILAFLTGLTASLFTFSRTTQILFAGLVASELTKVASRRQVLGAVIFIILVTLVFLALFPDVSSPFFERYFNEEGSSSTDDRKRQLSYFFDVISAATLSELIHGFGGQEAFRELSGSAMHTAVFSVILDAGVLPGICIFIFFAYAAFRSIGTRTTAFLVLAIITSFVLPYIPEMFFLLVMYIIIEVHTCRGTHKAA